MPVFDCIKDKTGGIPMRQRVAPVAFNAVQDWLFSGPEFLDEQLTAYGVERFTREPLGLDIEGEKRARLFDDDPAVVDAQIDEYLEVLDMARMVRPRAKLGFYGLPKTPWDWDWTNVRDVLVWQQEHRQLKRLLKRVDMICPVFYWRWLDGPPDGYIYRPIEDYQRMVATVCASIRAWTRKPIHPYFMGTVHDNAPPAISGTAFPKEQMERMTAANVVLSDGPMYWGRLASNPLHNERVLANFKIARDV